MKILICTLMMAAALGAQDAKSTKKTTGKLEIPKGAVETSTGLYRWTDKDGKVWMYRRSPFGISRYPADIATYDKQTSTEEETKAVEQGDSIRFERSTPFGK